MLCQDRRSSIGRNFRTKSELEAAIALSLEGNKSSAQSLPPVNENQDLDEEEELRRALELSKQVHSQPPLIPVNVPQEPEASNPNVTEISFRLPDGSKMVRRFLKQNTIRDVLNS